MNNKETKTTRAPYSNETFEIGKPYEFSDTMGFENPALRLLIKYDVPKGTYETETLTGHRYTYDYIRKPDLSSETVKVVYDKYVNYAKEKYAVPIEEKKESFEIGKPYEFAYQANFYNATIRILIGKDDKTGGYLTKNMTGDIYSYPYIRQAELNKPYKVDLYKRLIAYNETAPIEETKELSTEETKELSTEEVNKIIQKYDEQPPNIHKIYLPMVGRVLIFAHGCTDKELITFIDKEIGSKYATKQITKSLRELKNATAIHVYLPKECLGIIHIKRKAKDDQLSSLVHESLHFTLAVANHMGLILSWHSEEFFTYFQTHIFKTCKQYL